MNLREDLLRGIYAYGFEKPSAIQQRAIPPCIKGVNGYIFLYFCFVLSIAMHTHNGVIDAACSIKTILCNMLLQHFISFTYCCLNHLFCSSLRGIVGFTINPILCLVLQHFFHDWKGLKLKQFPVQHSDKNIASVLSFLMIGLKSPAKMLCLFMHNFLVR